VDTWNIITGEKNLKHDQTLKLFWEIPTYFYEFMSNESNKTEVPRPTFLNLLPPALTLPDTPSSIRTKAMVDAIQEYMYENHLQKCLFVEGDPHVGYFLIYDVSDVENPQGLVVYSQHTVERCNAAKWGKKDITPMIFFGDYEGTTLYNQINSAISHVTEIFKQ
jgi:hypothetical protein